MEKTSTLSIKTDNETKKMIKTAADRVGLSMNAFVITVVKQAAKSKNFNDFYINKINEAEIYNEKHKNEAKTWSALKNEYGV
jgi:antitoxin component of RelBE/YafQ-DinJ toxin-antitoxin module